MAASEQKKLPGVFISYRRSDTPDAVGRIYDRLVSEFGKGRVFKDVDSIPLGQDFRGHLNDIVGNCAAVLAIIGPKWTDIRSETGQKRLEDPDDFVRIELEAALARSVPVVPVLVGHAVMPGASQLPTSLATLVYRQSIEVRPDPDFHNDASRLLVALRAIIDPNAPSIVPHSDSQKRSWTPWFAALAAAMALAAIAMSVPTLKHLRETAPPETRLEINTPPSDDTASFALSPDGRSVVYVAQGEDATRLWLRPLASTTAQQLPGTEGATAPFWSPNSQSIGFFAGGALRRHDLGGGSAQVLAPAASGRGGTWNESGDIVFTQGPADPLVKVSESGGKVTPVTQLDPSHYGHRLPHFLPDGKRFLFVAIIGTASEIYLGNLDGSAPIRLASDPGFFRVAYLQSGWMLSVRSGALVAQRLDIGRAALIGEPVTLAEKADELSASPTGVVAYRRSPSGAQQLVWRNRSGAVLGTFGGQDAAIFTPRLSPNGRQVAARRAERGREDVWLLDGVSSRRTTFQGANNLAPIWSPDGRRIAFTSRRTAESGPDLYLIQSSGDGGETLLQRSEQTKYASSWSFDGRYLFYTSFDPETRLDIWVLPMTGELKPFPFLKSRHSEAYGQFSPDGKWVAYQSGESTRDEVYIRPFVIPGISDSAAPDASGQRQVSTTGGIHPAWSPDGKELFFVSPAGDIMSASITVTDTGLTPGAPVKLFTPNIFGGGVDTGRGRNYDISSDGRFLIYTVLDKAAPPITLIQNWNPDAGK